MARRLPKDLAWTNVVLNMHDPSCSVCGRRMHVTPISAGLNSPSHEGIELVFSKEMTGLLLRVVG